MGYIGKTPQYLSAIKGSDISSATNITIDGSSSYFDVTGTTTITGMTVDADRAFTLQFDGAVLLTHSSTLVLPADTNITTAAGDTVTFQSVTSNSVIAVNVNKADGTAVVLADNSITLAKMAGGTDGQIITYDASGDPVAVGPGTDGQVLTSTGAGSPPAFETLAGATVSQGTFTPTLQDASLSDSESVTYALQKGWYTKVNDIVHWSTQIGLTSIGSLSGYMHLAGFPFTSTSLANYEASFLCSFGYLLNLPAGASSLCAYMASSRTNAIVTMWSVTTGTDTVTPAELSGDCYIFWSGTYRAA